MENIDKSKTRYFINNIEVTWYVKNNWPIPDNHHLKFFGMVVR